MGSKKHLMYVRRRWIFLWPSHGFTPQLGIPHGVQDLSRILELASWLRLIDVAVSRSIVLRTTWKSGVHQAIHVLKG